jgi:hypothetical protein
MPHSKIAFAIKTATIGPEVGPPDVVLDLHDPECVEVTAFHRKDLPCRGRLVRSFIGHPRKDGDGASDDPDADADADPDPFIDADAGADTANTRRTVIARPNGRHGPNYRQFLDVQPLARLEIVPWTPRYLRLTLQDGVTADQVRCFWVELYVRPVPRVARLQTATMRVPSIPYSCLRFGSLTLVERLVVWRLDGGVLPEDFILVLGDNLLTFRVVEPGTRTLAVNLRRDGLVVKADHLAFSRESHLAVPKGLVVDVVGRCGRACMI